MAKNSSPRNPLRFLVTGGGGFLGKFLLEELGSSRPEAEVFYTFRRGVSPVPRAVACDLLDPSQADNCLRRVRPTYVLHLAGAPGSSDWGELWQAHVTTTFHLLEAVRRLSPEDRPSVVIAGSAAEYGCPRAGDLPLREDYNPRPVTLYGFSKHCQSTAALAYYAMGLRVMVARLFNLLGPGLSSHLSVGSFARQIAGIESGRLPPRLLVGSLNRKRDFVDVRDAARALRLIGEKGRPGEIYNVCSGSPVSLKSVVNALIDLSGKEIAVVTESGRKRLNDPPDVFGSGEKLKKDTGWAARIPWPKSLSDTFESFREQRAAV